MSSRCEVSIDKNIVTKIYKVEESFIQEKEAYQRLSRRKYIPELIELDEENWILKIAKISAPTLAEYVNKKSKIPYNLAKDLKDILIDMANEGIVDTPDFYKFGEHIFVEEDESIKIIDFDVNISFPKDDLNYDGVVNRRKQYIEKEYAFLDGEEESWNAFERLLFCAGLTKDVIDDFYVNILK